MPKYENPLIIAHRGASFEAPENTMAAFNLGWEQGADGVECDVHLTSDGVPVCHHDPNTKRQTGVSKTIANRTYEELSELNVAAFKASEGEPMKMPKLSELLETITGNRKIFIEIKAGAEAVAPIQKELVASNVNIENVIIMAFDSRVIDRVKKDFPALKAYWLDDFSHVFGVTISEEEINDILDTCSEIGADGLGAKNCSFISKKFLDALNKQDLELNVWTVDDPDEAVRFRKLGIDSVTSNKPGLVRGLLK